MANICIKSFQVLAAEDVEKEFLTGRHSAYTKYLPGEGRDGTRLFRYTPDKYFNSGSFIACPAAGDKVYAGMRIYPAYTKRDYMYISLCDNEDFADSDYGYFRFLTLRISKASFTLPDNTTIPHDGSPVFVELGFDGTYKEIRINGKTEYRSIASASNITFLKIYSSSYNYNEKEEVALCLQDFYINDGKGSINNSFWGDINVDAVATSSTQSAAGFVSSDGDSLHDAVQIPASKSSFMNGESYGDSASFDLAPIPNKRKPLSVAVTAGFLKKESGNYTLACDLHDGNIVRKGAAKPVPTGEYGSHSTIFNTKADGGEWTKTAVNDLAIGVRITEVDNG